MCHTVTSLNHSVIRFISSAQPLHISHIWVHPDCLYIFRAPVIAWMAMIGVLFQRLVNMWYRGGSTADRPGESCSIGRNCTNTELMVVDFWVTGITNEWNFYLRGLFFFQWKVFQDFRWHFDSGLQCVWAPTRTRRCLKQHQIRLILHTIEMNGNHRGIITCWSASSAKASNPQVMNYYCPTDGV